jgi:imidazolonepropionase
VDFLFDAIVKNITYLNRILNTIIKNIGNLYTPKLDGKYGEITHLTNVSLLIKDGTIEEIYHENTFSVDGNVDIIDAKGLTLLPGFVDAHTHPVFWNTRESEFLMRIEGKTYEEIAEAGGGIRNSARDFRNADKSDIKQRTANRIKTFLEYGTTTIEAKSGYGLSVDGEIKSLEIIEELDQELELDMAPTFLGAHEVPDEFRSNREEYIDLIIDQMIPEVTSRNLAEYCDVFCEKGVFTVEETRQILSAAEKAGLRSRIHADELHAFGAAELAAEMGAATADHLVEVSEQGINAMAEKNVIPVLLPATTFFLRKDKYAPARKMIDATCQVALATDFNPGSSMTQNMSLVWTIGALKLGMVTGELLWATTCVPAKSLNREKEIGSITIGKKADLVLMDIPNLDYLAYHMGINHVRMTVKNGNIVYQK